MSESSQVCQEAFMSNFVNLSEFLKKEKGW